MRERFPSWPPGSLMPGGVVFSGRLPTVTARSTLRFGKQPPEFGGILKRSVNKTPGQSRYNSTNREIGEGNELLGSHRAAGAAHGHVREA